MIDNNRDGTIDAADLKGTYASLGIMNVEDEMVNSMIKEAPAALTFTVFLGMLAEKLHGTDPEDVILDAFKEFDENNTGFIPKADLLELTPKDSSIIKILPMSSLTVNLRMPMKKVVK